ncbi:hypothetical protein Trydic_g17271 [Trypoxylus dichotomus]
MYAQFLTTNADILLLPGMQLYSNDLRAYTTSVSITETRLITSGFEELNVAGRRGEANEKNFENSPPSAHRYQSKPNARHPPPMDQTASSHDDADIRRWLSVLHNMGELELIGSSADEAGGEGRGRDRPRLSSLLDQGGT